MCRKTYKNVYEQFHLKKEPSQCTFSITSFMYKRFQCIFHFIFFIMIAILYRWVLIEGDIFFFRMSKTARHIISHIEQFWNHITI